MKSRWAATWLLGAVLVTSLPGLARADLKSFMARPEPAYQWDKKGEEKFDGGTIYDLHMTSQEWQGKNWKHRIQIFRPDKLDHPKHCLIYNTGGSGSAANSAMGMRLAKATGTTYAILYNIPNQPLYGLTEDALINYTWQKYMTTGDESWPLHFPMAKSVLKAMDTIQAFSKGAGMPEIDSFVINGGSKRGWTTWLAGASQDKRIKAIAPMVIDILNTVKQMRHMKSEWGKYSEQIGDYSPEVMEKLLDSEPFARLMKLEDPYSYKDILTLPKLLILGTNDRYWTQDALNLYWDDLKGPKWVLYTPNSGHGLEDRDRVLSTLAAFTRSVASGKKFPQMKWEYATLPSGAEITLKSDIKPKSARLFTVSSTTKDFRDSKWTSTEIDSTNGTYRTALEKPPSGYKAMFLEATYDIDGQPFTLSTQVRILGTSASDK